MFSAWCFLGWQFSFGKLFSACVGDGVDNGVWVVALPVYQWGLVVEHVLQASSEVTEATGL